jgi:hypothetical protein
MVDTQDKVKALKKRVKEDVEKLEKKLRALSKKVIRLSRFVPIVAQQLLAMICDRSMCRTTHHMFYCFAIGRAYA